jgi:serine/threonine-protein kinase HipA
MVFNILIDNTDDHEKNHALLAVRPGAHGSLRLAPAFDVLPTNSGQGMQEFVCGDLGHESTLANAMSQCEAFGLLPAEAAAEAAAVVEVVNGWQAHFRRAGVSRRDIEQLAERIDGPPLLDQRQRFDARAYNQSAARRRPTGPFQRG